MAVPANPDVNPPVAGSSETLTTGAPIQINNAKLCPDSHCL